MVLKNVCITLLLVAVFFVGQLMQAISIHSNFNYSSVLKIELVKLFLLLESYRQLHLRFSHEIITDIPDESCQFPQTQSNCQCHPLPDQLSFVIRSHLVDQ